VLPVHIAAAVCIIAVASESSQVVEQRQAAYGSKVRASPLLELVWGALGKSQEASTLPLPVVHLWDLVRASQTTVLHPYFRMQPCTLCTVRTAVLLVAVLARAGPAAAQKLVTQGGPFSNLSAQDFAATFAKPHAGSGILFNSAPAVRRE
jgi:hypothetical protein